MTDLRAGAGGASGDSKSPLIIRGGVAIDAPRDDSRKDITALLALGLRLENVGVFLGAGASCAASGKTLNQIWDSLQGAAPKTVEWLRQEGLLPANDDQKYPTNIETLASET